MGFTDAVRHCLQNYAGFSGRARRSEFWFFVLFSMIVNIVLALLDAALFGDADAVLSLVGSLALLLPSLAVGARRLHDVGRSGWWMLIVLVPLVGVIILLIWNVNRGEEGANRFGPDPRQQP